MTAASGRADRAGVVPAGRICYGRDGFYTRPVASREEE